ncbi:MAG: hypothetical protein ACRDK1_06225 [Solirubrobacterales bacterium]
MTALYPAPDLYASVVLLIAASAVLGQGILCLCGRDAWSWLAPAVGLAALVILAGGAIRLPGDDLTATVVIGLAVLGALVVLWIRRPEAHGALRAGLPIAVLIVAAASIAFVVAGGFGAFQGKSSDLGYYLYDTQWLQTHAGFEPSHIVKGFPMGPPALAAVTSNATGGASLVATFTAFTVAVAVASALASLAVFGELGAVRRTIAAFLVGLPYMGASFFVQSSFKELAVGMFALAFALLLRELAAEERHRDDAVAGSLAIAVPLALIAGAAVYTYSFAGLYWPIGTLGVWLVGSAVLARGRLKAQLRGWRLQVPRTRRTKILIGVAVVAAVAVAIPESNQVIEFARARGSLSALSGGSVSGDLPSSPRLFTALGTWPVTDYRTAVPNLWAERILIAAALIVLARGLFGLWRRRELAVLSAIAASVILYAAARIGSGPYVQSKAIAVMAPLIMLAAVFGALASPLFAARRDAGEPDAGAIPDPPRRPASAWAWAAVGAVFVFGALGSTYLALAGALVNDGTQSKQLESLRARVQGSTVIFLGSDDYVGWELRGARVFSPDRKSGVGYLPPKTTSTWTRYDFDSMNAGELNAAQYVIAARSPMMSETPRNFKLVATTDSFQLWQRIGATLPRQTFVEHSVPGDVLHCSLPSGRRISRSGGVAHVWSPGPVHGLSAAWKASSPAPASKGFRRPTALIHGRSLSQSLKLGRGRWAISLQYHSAEPVRFRGGGLDVRLPPNAERLGAFWPVGTITVPRPSTESFDVALEPLSELRNVLVGPKRLNTGSAGLVAGIGATPIGGRANVPLRRACGRFVDWYRTA